MKKGLADYETVELFDLIDHWKGQIKMGELGSSGVCVANDLIQGAQGVIDKRNKA